MDINRFTERVQQALSAAQTKAVRHGHQQIDVEHLLVALLEQAECQYGLNRAAELRYGRLTDSSKGPCVTDRRWSITIRQAAS